MFYLYQTVVSNYAFLVYNYLSIFILAIKTQFKRPQVGYIHVWATRGQDLRTRTRQSLVLDRESCPLCGISLSRTRNNE